MLTEMYDYYVHSEDFNEYVNKYMRKHGMIDVLAALKCRMIQDVYLYYKEENRK